MVTYNSAHCLPAQQQLLGSCPHITVVDNASLDSSIEQARRSFPWAKVHAMPSNLGFGAANNLALREANTEYALLLNPDCEINSENIIRLVDTADRYPDAAIVAPQLLTADRRSEINYRWPQLLWRSADQVHPRQPVLVLYVELPCCCGYQPSTAVFFSMNVFICTTKTMICVCVFGNKKSH